MQAKGDLFLTWEGSDDLSALDRLGPNDIDRFSLTGWQWLSESALAPLWRLAGLRSLDLSSSNVKGVDLEPLSNLKRLALLSLARTGVGAGAMRHVSGCFSLRILNVWATAVADEDVAFLHPVTHLEVLHFDSTRLTDRGMREIAALPSLRELGLRDTAVTDAGLMWLYGLSNLEMISLEGTSVSKEGIANLQAALPRCQIIY